LRHKKQKKIQYAQKKYFSGRITSIEKSSCFLSAAPNSQSKQKYTQENEHNTKKTKNEKKQQQIVESHVLRTEKTTSDICVTFSHAVQRTLHMQNDSRERESEREGGHA